MTVYWRVLWVCAVSAFANFNCLWVCSVCLVLGCFSFVWVFMVGYFGCLVYFGFARFVCFCSN